MFSSLKELHEHYHKICTCALKETATQPVFGDGNEKAEIVLIGEAPGKDEDRDGKPFIGRSGKLLTEIIAKSGFPRETVYITNTVKYRPPNNRDPLPEEKEACKEWLLAELNFIKPKLIVPVGRHAMWTFFPGESIGELHGKLLKKKIPELSTESFFPLYHPASAIYNQKLKETLFTDGKKLKMTLKKMSQK